MSILNKVDIYKEVINNLENIELEIRDIDNYEYEDFSDKEKDLEYQLDLLYDELSSISFDVSSNEEENIKIFIEDDDIDSIRNFISEKVSLVDGAKDELESKINNIYNLSEYYSNFDRDKIGINVKLYSQKYPDLEQIQEELIKKGYEKEEVELEVTEELLSDYVNQFNEDSWSGFEYLNTKGFTFLGSDGRSGGYAIFEVDTDDVNDLESFSQEIEELHNSVLNGLNVSDLVERIIDDGVVFTKEEKQLQKDEEEFEKNRAYTLTTTPTNKFVLSCPDMKVQFWDGDIGYIRGANVDFESDNLTLETIVNNLQDDYFGVQAILGGDNIEVCQILEVEKTYLDNNKTKKYTSQNEVFFGEILKKDKNLSDLVEVQEKPITEKFDPKHLNKIVSDYDTNSVNNKGESEDVVSQDADSKNKKTNKQR